MRRANTLLPKNLTLSICIGLLFHCPVLAQCVNTLATKTYDTAMTNTGFAVYSLSLPQFNPDSGQLVSVKLTAAVTNTYGFTLRNVNTVAATYQLNIGQDDQFTVQHHDPSPKLTPMSVGTYTLQPGETRTVAPFAFLTNHLSVDSIANATASFLGKGNVSLNYMSYTYTNLLAKDNASYFFSNTINSTTKLTVQYTYCKTGVTLAANLSRFTAALTAPRSVGLGWAAVNEPSGRQYEIQRSTDGHSFTTIATQAADAGGMSASYDYTDRLSPATTGPIFYRLQMNDQGNFSWSAVRCITLDAPGATLRIYPNPATDFIEIATGSPSSSWQADVLSAGGTLIQRQTFMQSNLLRLAFRARLPAGVYFLRLTDLHGQQSTVTSFTIGGN